MVACESTGGYGKETQARRLQNVSMTRVEYRGLARTEADNEKLVNSWNPNP